MKHFVILLAIILMCLSTSAQIPYDWHRLDSLAAHGDYRTADTLAKQYLAEAVKANDAAGQLTASFYMAAIDHAIDHNALRKVLPQFQKLTYQLTGTDRTVAYALLLQNYKALYDRQNRRLGHFKLSDDPNLPFFQWNIQRVTDSLAMCTDSILTRIENLDISQFENTQTTIPVSQTPYAHLFATSQATPAPYDPSLRGALVETLLDNLATDQQIPSATFLPLQQFARQDTASPAYPQTTFLRIARLYADSSDNIRLWIDLLRLNYIQTDSNYVRILDTLAFHYPKACPDLLALLNLRKAQYLTHTDRPAEAEQVCLETERLYPGTNSASLCRQLRHQICRPSFTLVYEPSQSSQRSRLAYIEAKNTPLLNFRIVEHIDISSLTSTECMDTLMSLEPLKQWQQPLPDAADHRSHRHLVALPPMPQGEYELIAYDDSNFCHNDYFSSDVTFITYSTSPSARRLISFDKAAGHIVDRLSGEPMTKQKVTLHSTGLLTEKEYHRHRRTDSQGYYRFPTSSLGYMFKDDLSLSVHNGDYDYLYNTFYNELYTTPFIRNNQREVDIVMTDRPIYRLGDTMQFSCLTYRHHVRGKTWQQHIRLAKRVRLNAILSSPNDDYTDTIRLTTDRHGRAQGSFVIPADGQNGSYTLTVQSANLRPYALFDRFYSTQSRIHVEAYKPPHFTVSLALDSTGHGHPRRFDRPVTLYGTAVTYSGAPMEGAKVRWEAWSETQQDPDQFWSISKNCVANDSLTVGPGGQFQFTFTPKKNLKDSQNSTSSTTQIYNVNAIVIDADGESHDQQLTFRVSDADGYLLPTTDDLGHLTFAYNDFDHHPLPGAVRVELYQLRQPDTLRTLSPLQSDHPDARWVGDKSLFRQLFPSYAFTTQEADPRCWPVMTKRLDQTTCRRRLDIPGLPSALYRMVLTAPDSSHLDTLVNYVAPNGSVAGNNFVWNRIELRKPQGTADTLHTTHIVCAVGDTVRITFGCPYGQQQLYYRVLRDAKIYHRGMITLDSSHTTILSIPVTKKMDDQCKINLSALRENLQFTQTLTLHIAQPHRYLTVATETLRDKLQPGEQEQWTFRITDADSSGLVANLCLTLFDHALEQYGQIHFGFNPWMNRYYRLSNNVGIHDNSPRTSLRHSKMAATPTLTLATTRLLGFNLSDMATCLKSDYTANTISCIDIARMPGNSVEAIVAAVAGVGYSGTSSARGESSMVTMTHGVRKRTGVSPPKEAIAEIASPLQPVPTDIGPANIRRNLSTLATFQPMLRSDKEGRVSLSVTMPDALTQWSLYAFAWTDKMQTGRFFHTLQTQKTLMAQPQLPRFVRQGDTLYFRTKVSNLSDSSQPLRTTVTFADEVSLRTVSTATYADTLKAHGSTIVTHRLVVPDTLHSLTYRVTTQNALHSDGEQGRLPVLSHHQRLTESRLLYLPASLDGQTVSRTFSIPVSRHLSDSLSISLSANPADYAVAALPHFKRHLMPGNIYLANSIYIEHLASLLDSTDKARRRAAARFTNDLHKLLHSQNHGGWSWMPLDHEASRYVTESILQRLAACPSLDSDSYYRTYYKTAIEYLDRQLVETYTDTSKRDLVGNTISLLYTRSLYNHVKPLAQCDSLTQQAYSHYYNAFKSQNPANLPLQSRGQMALTLLHFGDTAEAVGLAKRIKGISQLNDEMGMYWAENVSGYGWYQRPVETAALMVDVFADVLADWESVGRIQQWILQAKRGTIWQSDMATAEAVRALLRRPQGYMPPEQNRLVATLNGQPIPSENQTLPMPDKDTLMDIQLSSTSSLPSWGAVFHQYEAPMDSIRYGGSGITLRKTISRINADGSLTLIADSQTATAELHVGDRIRVHIDIDCQRDMDNLVLHDDRATAFEPVSTLSGWQWNSGMRYYVDVRDEGINCYINRLNQGHYYCEYDLIVRHTGTFNNGIATLYSVYAPEFRANTNANQLRTNP